VVRHSLECIDPRRQPPTMRRQVDASAAHGRVDSRWWLLAATHRPDM